MGDTRPVTFLAASEYKPEELASNTARAFLGVNLGCAQCHDHPFARWTRNQFWQTAAFFATPANVCMADGSVQFLKASTGSAVVAALVSVDGGEVLSAGDY